MHSEIGRPAKHSNYETMFKRQISAEACTKASHVHADDAFSVRHFGSNANILVEVLHDGNFARPANISNHIFQHHVHLKSGAK